MFNHRSVRISIGNEDDVQRRISTLKNRLPSSFFPLSSARKSARSVRPRVTVPSALHPTLNPYQVPATAAEKSLYPSRLPTDRSSYPIQGGRGVSIISAEMANSKYEYVKSFEVNEKLMPFTWIVVRIDGCHFRRFTEEHKFDKPNDMQGLNLMNACAIRVLQKFSDIIFAYGISDEYSFVLKKMTEWYERRSSKISHVIATSFSSLYTMKWKEFFPEKELKDPPCFDARAVCYPSTKILRDYLAWRQVDCHINNQYNTCFWMLVKSGRSKAEAQEQLKGTQTQEKNELLFQQFGINYNTLPAMFRKGSCVFRDKVEEIVKFTNNGDPIKRYIEKVVIGHNDIIDPKFWEEHPHILGE